MCWSSRRRRWISGRGINLGVELAKFEDISAPVGDPDPHAAACSRSIRAVEKELSAPELERRRREPGCSISLATVRWTVSGSEREDSSGKRIPTNRIVPLFEGPPVKLALLNACWSATDLVASLCDRLTKEGGIPAAIGHGNPVADASAIEFAREFYRHVVLGKSVGAAKNLAANQLAERQAGGDRSRAEGRGNPGAGR